VSAISSTDMQYDIGEFARRYELAPEEACRIIDYAGGDRNRADAEARRLTQRTNSESPRNPH
jgi:hypothetical protein